MHLVSLGAHTGLAFARLIAIGLLPTTDGRFATPVVANIAPNRCTVSILPLHSETSLQVVATSSF